MTLKLRESLFDDVFVDMMVGHNKLHNHREKADISFEVTYEKFAYSEACYCLEGTIKVPVRKSACSF